MPSTDDVRMERLEQSLARHFDFAWTRLRPFRAGVDAWVDALDLADGRMLVVKTPKLEVQHTRYERTVAFGAELPRQLAAAAELRRAGVPTPRILAHHSRSRGSEEPSWLVMEFVDHEDSDWEDPTLQRELGTLARRIHHLEPPPKQALAAGLLDRGTMGWGAWIVGRILDRLDAARAYMEIPVKDRIQPRLLEIAGLREDHARSLLHLDLRQPNIAVRSGRIVSLFDLGNAIVGDPFLELARIRAAGLLTGAFCEGYGLDPRQIEDQGALLDAYELDVAALLVVVSREEFDDSALHERMAERTGELLRRLGTTV